MQLGRCLPHAAREIAPPLAGPRGRLRWLRFPLPSIPVDGRFAAPSRAHSALAPLAEYELSRSCAPFDPRRQVESLACPLHTPAAYFAYGSLLRKTTSTRQPPHEAEGPSRTGRLRRLVHGAVLHHRPRQHHDPFHRGALLLLHPDARSRSLARPRSFSFSQPLRLDPLSTTRAAHCASARSPKVHATPLAPAHRTAARTAYLRLRRHSRGSIVSR